MGLFRDLGEKVERFKQQAEQASREQAPYECAECGTAIHIERDDCPECGSENIRQHQNVEADQADATAADESTSNETESDAREQ